ncbi:MAG: carbon monoxide dehydrogenase subunit G [Alphaproteobacteria bacterium]
MELSGEYLIPAPKQAVWDALNDPDVLKQCIPGCDSLEKTSDTTFEAAVTAKVGPVKAKFQGAVTLSDIDAPNGYTISGEGKGGAAGFAKGGARVTLEEAEGGTLLKYTVDAMVGGKLAQIGARLIEATSKKMSAEFFGRFAEIVAAAEPEAAAEAAPSAEPPVEPAQSQPEPKPEKDLYGVRWKGYSPTTWISGMLLLILILLAIHRYGFSGG